MPRIECLLAGVLSILLTLVEAQKSSTNATECDDTCQRDVKYLEGFIVLVVVVMAVGVGFCCMHTIDTPSKFAEPPKQGHQD